MKRCLALLQLLSQWRKINPDISYNANCTIYSKYHFIFPLKVKLYNR
jgi:hypothetical protein